MTVLYIIGVLAIVIVLLMLVGWVNALSQRKYDYEFFTYGNLALATIAYALLFFGGKFYLDALSAHGDILNGILMMGIGAIIILGVLIWHIKHTSFIFGLLFGTNLPTNNQANPPIYWAYKPLGIKSSALHF